MDAAEFRARLLAGVPPRLAAAPFIAACFEGGSAATGRKEIARGHALDAFGFYVNSLLRPLIELAGMRHRPERFDCGWRYVHHDLPAELQQALT